MKRNFKLSVGRMRGRSVRESLSKKALFIALSSSLPRAVLINSNNKVHYGELISFLTPLRENFLRYK